MAMSKNSIQTQCHKLREPLSILIKYKTTVTPKIFGVTVVLYNVITTCILDWSLVYMTLTTFGFDFLPNISCLILAEVLPSINWSSYLSNLACAIGISRRAPAR
jgi:hypothetical protein